MVRNLFIQEGLGPGGIIILGTLCLELFQKEMVPLVRL